MIAALFVMPRGVYYGLPGVDPWGEDRDARTYPGPYPVVAHPPCARWGRYWSGGPSCPGRFRKGDDDGCFAAALDAVRRWGGVIEHPEGSHAWKAFGLIAPPRSGGWVVADWQGGWTCCVEQGAYGHLARKATWLYACSAADLPSLRWGRAKGDFVRMDEGFHSTEERRRAVKTGVCQRMSKRQREATPPEFRDVLVGIAKGCKPKEIRQADDFDPVEDAWRSIWLALDLARGGDGVAAVANHARWAAEAFPTKVTKKVTLPDGASDKSSA